MKNAESFPNYIEHFPEGAIARKVKIITSYLEDDELREEFYFFSKDEIDDFIDNTSQLIIRIIEDNLGEVG